jgi:branched-chain amino acid aminotransferase
MKIWVNGEFIDRGHARVSLEAGALHYGASAFDGIICIGSANKRVVFKLQKHLARLQYSATLLGFEVPYSTAELSSAISKLCRINKIGCCYLRPIIFSNSHYTKFPHSTKDLTVAVICEPFDCYKFFLQMRRPIKVLTIKDAAIFKKPDLVKAKISGKYLSNLIALIHAQKNGFEDAIMLDDENTVLEATAANLFIVKNRQLKTPYGSKVLNGTVRESVMQIAKDSGYTAVESEISLNELYTADEIFTTGTAKGIVSIIQVDLEKIKPPQNSITKHIRKTYQNIITGRNKKYHKWLTVLE